MPSTLVHGTLPSACLWYSSRKTWTKKDLLKLWLLTAFLANSPDLDLLPVLLFPDQWFVFHRFVGHNLFSATLLSLLGVYAFKRLFPEHLSARERWITAFSLVFSHLFLDAMGDVGADGLRPGVPLLWPFTQKQWVTPFFLFTAYKLPTEYHHPVLKYLHAPEFWTQALLNELCVSVVLFGLWMIIDACYKKIGGKRKKNVANQPLITTKTESQGESP